MGAVHGRHILSMARRMSLLECDVQRLGGHLAHGRDTKYTRESLTGAQ